MRVSFQSSAAHPRQEFGEGRIFRQVSAENQCINETSDQIFRFPGRSVGDGETNPEVILPVMAPKKGLQSRHQRDECRSTLAPADAQYGLRQFRRESEVKSRPAITFFGWAYIIGRQIKSRKIRQLFAPERK